MSTVVDVAWASTPYRMRVLAATHDWTRSALAVANLTGYSLNVTNSLLTELIDAGLVREISTPGRVAFDVTDLGLRSLQEWS